MRRLFSKFQTNQPPPPGDGVQLQFYRYVADAVLYRLGFGPQRQVHEASWGGM